MGSIISKIADEIALHGSYEAYCAFRDKQESIITLQTNGFPFLEEFLPLQNLAYLRRDELQDHDQTDSDYYIMGTA